MKKAANQNSGIVIKVGGSLFDFPELRSRLQQLLEAEMGSVCLVAGGGGFADEVRRLEPLHQLDVQQSHRLAIRAMSLSASFLSELLQLPVVRGWNTIHASIAAGRTCIVDLAELPGLERIPSGWNVTSDSLAAWLASELQVSLMLVKSVDLPGDSTTVEDLVQNGLIDSYLLDESIRPDHFLWTNLRRPTGLTVESVMSDT